MSDARVAKQPEPGEPGVDDLRDFLQRRRIPSGVKFGTLAAVPIGFAFLASAILYRNPELTLEKKVSGVIVGVAFSLILAAFPLLISYSQTIAKERQLRKLDNLKVSPVRETTHYKVAYKSVRRLQAFSLNDDDYFLPMVTFEVVLIAGCLSVLLATFVDHIFEVPSFLFGGMEAIGGRLKPDAQSAAAVTALADYQRGSFVAIGMAFFGSYVYMLYRLLDRVNNNDLYPISFYYYAARFIIACIVAVVFRHVAHLFGIDNSMIVLIGFTSGIAPDLFIVAMSRKAFQLIKVIGYQPDPKKTLLPTSMNLFMIEGMTRDKIDRLNELGIDSAQTLAQRNPLLLWTRLPYDLSQLVDWMAQAQLYVWAKEEKTKALRDRSINNIFDLRECLRQSETHADLAKFLGVSESLVAAYGGNLDQAPSFTRLQEVRIALAQNELSTAGGDEPSGQAAAGPHKGARLKQSEQQPEPVS